MEAETMVTVRTAPDGRPVGARARARIERPVADVWAALRDVEAYARFLPMVHRVQRDGDRLTFELRFRISLFSTTFRFTADATYEEQRWLELRWVAGEPRGIRLRFDLTPEDGGRACIVDGDGELDLQSLGWLAKYFLKHHPEIEFGVLPGVALVLVDSLRRAVSGGPAAA
jgi:hypothetical protein